ncbi:MAG: PQQ-binding-like beta-propeller repeat protein [Pirellulales bacterium]
MIAVEPDKALFTRTRNRLENAGLYGTRVMIFNRPLGATGLPNMVANLIVSRQAMLQGEVLAEAQRTQRPYGGVICKGKDDGMSIDRRAEIKGAGSWTHQYANPANTLCSGDTAVSGQLTMLWYRDYNLPSASRWWKPPAPLADNGILYHSCPNGLIAVDAYNGTEIWRFESKDLLSTRAGLYVLRTGAVFCLGDGVLYLRRKAQCLCLDAKTGKLIRTISLPDTKAYDFWGYLAYSDGIVYGTAADTSHSTTNPYPYNKTDSINEGKTFFAVDAKTGRILWQHEPKNHIGNTAVAIDDRNVYVIDRTSIWLRTRKEEQEQRRGTKSKPIESGRLTALDKKTGAVKWTNNTHVFGSAVLVSGPARRVCVWHEDKMTGFDADSGKHVYSIQSPYAFNVYVNRAPTIVGDAIYWVSSAFDLRRGKKLAYALSRSYGCGSVSASQSMLFFRSGTIGYVDLNAPRANKEKITTADIQNFGGIRPGCYINIVPAGGIVLVPDTSSSCSCSYFNQCWLALQPAEASVATKRPNMPR